MLLPSAIRDGSSSRRANSPISSLHSTSSPAPGHSKTSSRMPQSHNPPSLALPAITISAVSSPPAPESHIANIFSSVRPGVSSAARAAGILTTCKRLHQILSLDSTSRIANGGVLGCASGLSPQPSMERAMPSMARTPSPAMNARGAGAPSTPKKRRTAAANTARSTPKLNAKAKSTRSISAQTLRTVSSSSLKVVVTATQAPSTPTRPLVVRLPKTPMRRNKRRRAIGGVDQSSDEDDKFYTLPVQRNKHTLLVRNYTVNPRTPHKRTKVATSENAGAQNLVFGPSIGGGEPGGSGVGVGGGAVPRARRRAMTTSSHNISRPMQASRIYNQRTQAQEGPSGAYINRVGHSRVKSMADVSTIAHGSRRYSDTTPRRPNLLPPDEAIDLNSSIPPAAAARHELLSPNSHALSNLSLNSPQPVPRHRESSDAMDITPSNGGENSSNRLWTHHEDRHLLELVLKRLQLTHQDLEECAKSLGMDTKMVEARWEEIMGGLGDGDGKKVNATPVASVAAPLVASCGTSNKPVGRGSPFGARAPVGGSKVLRRTTKRIGERSMSVPSREGSFKENL